MLGENCVKGGVLDLTSLLFSLYGEGVQKVSVNSITRSHIKRLTITIYYLTTTKLCVIQVLNNIIYSRDGFVLNYYLTLFNLLFITLSYLSLRCFF